MFGLFLFLLLGTSTCTLHFHTIILPQLLVHHPSFIASTSPFILYNKHAYFKSFILSCCTRTSELFSFFHSYKGNTLQDSFYFQLLFIFMQCMIKRSFASSAFSIIRYLLELWMTGFLLHENVLDSYTNFINTTKKMQMRHQRRV